MDAMKLSELSCTGKADTSSFHGLSAGNTVHASLFPPRPPEPSPFWPPGAPLSPSPSPTAAPPLPSPRPPVPPRAAEAPIPHPPPRNPVGDQVPCPAPDLRERLGIHEP